MYKIKLLFVSLFAVVMTACGLWTANWAYVWFSDPTPMASAEVVMLIATAIFGLLLVAAVYWMKDLLSERPRQSSLEKPFSDPNYEWNTDF